MRSCETPWPRVVITMNNELITLVTVTAKTEDDDGFKESEATVRTDVFAETRSAGVIEHYEAMRSGVSISLIFAVDTDDYQSAIVDQTVEGVVKRIKPSKVEYDGETYRIQNTRRKTDYKKTEIVCEEVE